MTWIAGQLTIPPQLIESWIQLGVVLALCSWFIGMRRAAVYLLILALVPFLLPAFQPLFEVLKANLLSYVPWYVLLIAGFFFIFIVLRSVISLFLGSEVATRTTSDLLTISITAVFGAVVALIVILSRFLAGLFRR